VSVAGETEFMMSRFRTYYVERPPPPPDRFGRREFGFMFFDKSFVQRHLAFPKKSELHAFLKERVPAHVYYSSAYYEIPDAERMEDKKWLGADLIFDLDADHIPGADQLTYTEMLARVKAEMIRLLDEYILGDLGFDEKKVKVTFSGGRGYHAHVFDPRVLSLRSHERREIVDYVTGTDLSVDWLMPEEVRVDIRIKAGSRSLKTRVLLGEDRGGWRGKVRPGLISLLDEMEDLGPKDAMARYKAFQGEREEVVTGLFEDLFQGARGRRGRDLILTKGNLANVRDKHQAAFLRLVDMDLKPRLAGEVDEPVTSDIKRLIRMPYSLHGKTGLRVVPMRRADLDEFEPLRDAVPDTLTDEPIRLHMNRDVDVALRGERFILRGDVDVPEFAALFFVCRREATLSGTDSLD